MEGKKKRIKESLNRANDSLNLRGEVSESIKQDRDKSEELKKLYGYNTDAYWTNLEEYRLSKGKGKRKPFFWWLPSLGGKKRTLRKRTNKRKTKKSNQK